MGACSCFSGSICMRNYSFTSDENGVTFRSAARKFYDKLDRALLIPHSDYYSPIFSTLFPTFVQNFGNFIEACRSC